MLIKIFEIIFAIFTVYGIYTFVHDLVDILVDFARKREIKKLEEERKESEDLDDTEQNNDRR